MTNPLLQDWDTPFGLAPFDAISDDDFAPALDEALTAHRAEIDAIAGDPNAPDFDNTIGAMAGRLIRVWARSSPLRGRTATRPARHCNAISRPSWPRIFPRFPATRPCLHGWPRFGPDVMILA